MNTNKTREKRGFSNTIGAGLRSIGGKGRTFFNLEFKTSSQLHRAGSYKEIIIDYIEIGRSPKCQIRFGEDCKTVSRVHCAIVREGQDYYVKHLSTVNPTLINGKPVADKWYIHSGDEIQLSYGGPVIGFNVPANNFTNSIPLTRRLSLFREQAMRPYKRAIAILSVIFLLSISGLSYYLFEQSKVIAGQTSRIEKLNSQIERDSLKLVELRKKGEISEKDFNRKLQELKSRGTNPVNSTGTRSEGLPEEIKKLSQSIYFVEVERLTIEADGIKKSIDYAWRGTGFLLEDGRFVTARHIIEAWYFGKDEISLFLNETATRGGKVTAYFRAYSSSGDAIAFSSDDFYFDNSGDKIKTYNDSTDNTEHKLTSTRIVDDWAFGKYSSKGGLQIDSKLSNNLPVSTQLFTLGFPFGTGAIGSNEIEPKYSQFFVSSTGISNGAISISSRSFDKGNSGGPVFAFANNQYKVVGIVSHELGAQGLIIPISKIN